MRTDQANVIQLAPENVTLQLPANRIIDASILISRVACIDRHPPGEITMFARIVAAVSLAAALPALPAQTTPSFDLKRDTTPAHTVQKLAEGDFNNDGKPDLVVGAGATTSDITLRLGNGDGSFQAPVVLGTADFPVITDLAVADLNHDGNLDLIAVSGSSAYDPSTGITRSTGDFQVYLGNGHGGFLAPLYYKGTHAPYSVAVGDFNGDGLNDLAVGEDQNTVEIFNNVGGDNFVPVEQISLGNFGNQVKVRTGDLTGDGQKHIAASGFPGIFVLWNDGHENFAVASVDTQVGTDITVADANQDGIDDILGSGQGNAEVVNGQTVGTAQIDISYGLGNRKFSTIRAVKNVQQVGATGIEAADVNGDGIADLVASNNQYSATSATAGMFVWLGNPDGSCNQTPLIYSPTGHNVGSMVAGDWNRDGMMDFAMALRDDSQVEFVP